MKSSRTFRALLGLSILLLAATLPCLGAEPGGPFGIGISLAPTKPGFDVGERAAFVFEITNMTSDAIFLPAFDAVGKMEDGNVLGYLKARLLQIHVRQGTNLLAMNPGGGAPSLPVEGVICHPVSLKAGTAMRAHFSLTRHGYPSFGTHTNPGVYTASVTFDTRSCKEEGLLKGVWTSPPATFRLVPFPEFRPRARRELPEAYARARITFYLKRMVQRQGEYYANVASVLSTEGSGAALIELRESRDPGIAGAALDLLRQIHHRLGLAGAPPMPASKADWMTWWRQTGSKIPAQELFSNFDSHFQ